MIEKGNKQAVDTVKDLGDGLYTASFQYYGSDDNEWQQTNNDVWKTVIKNDKHTGLAPIYFFPPGAGDPVCRERRAGDFLSLSFSSSPFSFLA